MKANIMIASLLALACAEARVSTAGQAPGMCPHGTFVHARKLYAPLPSGADVWARCNGVRRGTGISYFIDTSGRATQLQIVFPSGCKYADELLKACIERWKYEPATCDGVSVPERGGLSQTWHQPAREGPRPNPCPEEPPAPKTPTP
jgi:hypothetical protein